MFRTFYCAVLLIAVALAISTDFFQSV